MMQNHIQFVQTLQFVILFILVVPVGYKVGKFFINYRVFKKVYTDERMKNNLQDYIEDKALEKKLKFKSLEEKNYN